MSDDDKDYNATNDNTNEEKLFEEEVSCGGDEDFLYDEEGSFALSRPLQPLQPIRPRPLLRPCSLATLNGSWLLNLTPTGPHLPMQIRGPMRIEVQSSRLRISGDVYVRSFLRPIRPIRPAATSPTEVGSFVPGSLVIRRNWYPAFPHREYRWYFRSTGVRYARGRLLFKFERHLWSNASQSFVSRDRGWMDINCQVSLIRPIGAPRPTIEMEGMAMIGGSRYNVTVTKTSP